ncbi:MAG: hypothetical protein A2Z02_05230 [Chloroflexi bacterium RBG_16_48_7]|nr:MAG: hypothetical protein A2Z02_05230 [Chloroflexi bacterium RBG_16_48_7]
MKKKNIKINFKDISVQSIDMQHHREALRKALLTSNYWDKQREPKYLQLKGGQKIMVKIIVMAAGLALCALVIVLVSTIVIPNATNTAYAKQVADQSYHAVSNLSSEQLGKLKTKIIGDPHDLLQQARNARDLKVLTYEEFIATNLLPVKNGGPADLLDAEFLQFTDADGDKVIIGVDRTSNLPVVVVGIHIRIQSNGQEKPGNPNDIPHFSVSNEDGTITIDGKRYAVPGGAASGQQSVQVKDGTVYINGVKAAPLD